MLFGVAGYIPKAHVPSNLKIVPYYEICIRTKTALWRMQDFREGALGYGTPGGLSNTPALQRSVKGLFRSFHPYDFSDSEGVRRYNYPFDPYGSLSGLTLRRVLFTDGILHLIRDTLKKTAFQIVRGSEGL